MGVRTWSLHKPAAFEQLANKHNEIQFETKTIERLRAQGGRELRPCTTYVEPTILAGLWYVTNGRERTEYDVDRYHYQYKKKVNWYLLGDETKYKGAIIKDRLCFVCVYFC